MQQGRKQELIGYELLLSASYREKAKARCSPSECHTCMKVSSITLSSACPSNKTSSPRLLLLLQGHHALLLHTPSCSLCSSKLPSCVLAVQA